MVTKKELQKALVMKNLQLQSSGATNLKQYEIAFQDVIEGMFPDKCWWQVTDCDIFGKLFETRDPDMVIMDIIANLKPDALEENIQISSRFGRKLIEGKTYEYKGYTIDAFEDCWRVYNRNNGKQVGRDFATDKDAEEYIDSLTESLKESKSTDYRGYVIDYDFYGNGEYTVQYCGDDITFDSEQEAKAFIDNLYESFTGSGKPNIRESKVRTYKGNKRVNRHTSHKLTESVNRKHRNRTLREWVDVDGIEHPNDDMGGYTCYSYYGRDYMGLEDDFETYDYTDVELWVWKKLHQGNYCVVETPDGRLYFNPDKVEYGEEVYGIEDYLDESKHRNGSFKHINESKTTWTLGTRFSTNDRLDCGDFFEDGCPFTPDSEDYVIADDDNGQIWVGYYEQYPSKTDNVINNPNDNYGVVIGAWKVPQEVSYEDLDMYLANGDISYIDNLGESISDNIRKGNLKVDADIDALYDEDGDTYVQFQDRESHAYTLGKDRHPRVSSKTWGRVWKNGKFDKQFEGPKYKVRQDVARYLDDIEESVDEERICVNSYKGYRIVEDDPYWVVKKNGRTLKQCRSKFACFKAIDNGEFNESFRRKRHPRLSERANIRRKRRK